MRELVYLSDRKLRQFQAPKKPRRFAIREISIPGLGQVSIDPQADSHLDAVIAHLHGMARWYEEDVPVGQWVHFEARLGWRTVVSPDSGLRVLLFAEPAGQASTRRLVLHGAPEHLLGGVLEQPAAEWGDRFSSLGEVVRPLMRHLAKTAATGRTSKRHYENDLPSLMRFLDREVDARAAGWMGGFARVTVDTAGEPVVIASPLYVEYVPPPDQ